jgi:hypothetical protein
MIYGFVRHLMGLASGWAIAQGFGTADLWMAITGGVVAGVTILLSIISKRNAKKAIDNAGAADPNVYNPNDPYKNTNPRGY